MQREHGKGASVRADRRRGEFASDRLETQQQIRLVELDYHSGSGDRVQILKRWQAARELQAAIAELEQQQAEVTLSRLVGVSKMN
ncbi:hypothetical protein KR51_00025770 [Rubidibacter lacunae KORDI 51-2]|uniref:Uncharacterized protein n=1 Tax=Rubidibacter lacunae KORDI 51-2 TaxID=582515 RepID=U5DGZ1_9CHRO|nr:hypothetical protein [Rubidibacter lacunae]ERN40866.1 hypothetical protein KR51_00025770 [Rubidibacter lacunae KORDI 51-2]